MLLSQEFEGYKKYFEKCGLSMNQLDTLGSYKITMIKETYEKQGRKNFPSKPTTTETEILDPRAYCCIVSGMAFFHDRVHKGYNSLGYEVVDRLTAVRPDNQVKIVRKFRYERV